VLQRREQPSREGPVHFAVRGAPCLAALARHGTLASAHNLQEVCHPEPRVLQRSQQPSREGPVHFAVRVPHVSLPLRDMGLSAQRTIYKKFVILSPACSSAAGNCPAKDLCISPPGAPHVSLFLRDMGLSAQRTIYKKFVILSPACSSAAGNCPAKDLCISPSGDPMSRCLCETPRAPARRAAIPRRTPAFCNSPRPGFSHNFSTPHVTNNLYLKF
jgi:hypothetical protein